MRKIVGLVHGREQKRKLKKKAYSNDILEGILADLATV
jgi:hypothetical protein